MSSGEPRVVSRLGADTAGSGSRRARADFALTVATYAALLVAMFPLVRVVTPGAWTLGVLVLPALVLATGWFARIYRLPAIAVSLAELAVGVFALTAVFLGDRALFGVIPTPRAVTRATNLVSQAIDLIASSAAPVEASAALAFLIVAGMLMLTIVIDHVVLTAHMPLLAAIALIAVWLIPAIIVPREVDVPAFVMLAVAILALLRVETRRRDRDAAGPQTDAPVPWWRVPRDAEPYGTVSLASATTGIGAAATGIGAVAIVVAIVAAPLFADSVVRPGSGPGGRWNTIDASLQFGDDLRRQTDAEVLQLRTDATSAPYLRVATLTDFDGQVWLPDRGRTVSLQSSEAFQQEVTGDDLRFGESVTSIRIVNLVSASAPVPFPAVGVTGLDGEWESLPQNSTIVSRSDSVHGQDYEVITRWPRPTLEQIRAAPAAAEDTRDAATALPADLPEVIRALAQEVTASATNDYDALTALQRWFRSSEFRYSLNTPVSAGFDGSGAAAIAQFLEVREGYCIHFASAFALMARTLGMPARVVVGYLPGTSATLPQSGDRVYSVSSSQLHAWPEVHFTGIGWIPFEPTNGLGSPTSFAPAAVTPGLDDPDAAATPLPTASASPEASIAPEFDDGLSGDSSVAPNPLLRLLPWIGPILGVLFLLAIPALIKEVRRRDLLNSARIGDAGAAWRFLQDAAIDLGISVAPDESPRAFGARLIARHGAPGDDVQELVDAIEFASYSPMGRRWRAGDLSLAARSARAAITRSAPRFTRVLSVVAPRSLLVRPGSVYADTPSMTR